VRSPAGPAGSASRAEALARFRTTRQRAASAGCNYWVFEEPTGTAGGAGAWVEFYEARDPDALRSALRQLQPDDPADPILREVELD
jgi:hypothetical protein